MLTVISIFLFIATSVWGMAMIYVFCDRRNNPIETNFADTMISIVIPIIVWFATGTFLFGLV